MAILEERAGLYVHIPFCLKKCRYCDFYSVTDLSLEKPFVHALKQEMRQKSRLGGSFDTLYLGGGTPSILQDAHLASIMEEALTCFDFEKNREVTIEVNPGTVTRSKLDFYLQTGIERLNIGIQSFTDSNLAFLGRSHTALTALMAVNQAREAGFANIGLDLIIGLPGQERTGLQADLECALSFQPEHLSCYMLSYEPRTPLDQMRKRGRVTPLEEDRVGDLYEFLSGFLEEQGYEHYEISNFARRDPGSSHPPHRSRHNQKYWNHTPYIGVGPAAHSFIRPRRFWNGKNLRVYMDALTKGLSPMAEEEILSPQQELMEAVALGLRTQEGIGFDDFRKRFGVDLQQIVEKEALPLKEAGRLSFDDEHLWLTRKGFLIADAVTLRLIDAMDVA